ncbi:MAG: hypothetical protein V1676_05385 [Candidatus Diapherotrites archaeon]
MDSKQAMSIFIIIVMVGSIIGFAMMFLGDKPAEQAPPAGNGAAPTAIAFKAENVDANVVEIFPSMRLIATTDKPELSAIDSQVRSASGVRNISSYFAGSAPEGSTGALLYIAEVTFDPARSASEIISAITEKSDALYDIEAYPYGLVSVPKTVAFYNADLEMSKNYTFPNPLIQSILASETMKGDSIQVEITADFVGGIVSKMLTYETYNPNSGMMLVSAVGNYKVSALLPALIFNGTVPLPSSPESSTLKSELLAVQGVNDANLEFSNPDYTINLELDQNIGSEISADFNSALFAISGVLNVTVQEPATLKVKYGRDASVSEVEKALRSAVSDAGFSVKELKIPEINISAEISLSEGVDSSAAASGIAAILSKYSIDAKPYRKAVFDYNSVADNEGKQYSVEGGMFEATVVPGRLAGDEVELSLFFFATRNNAGSISAHEMEE